MRHRRLILRRAPNDGRLSRIRVKFFASERPQDVDEDRQCVATFTRPSPSRHPQPAPRRRTWSTPLTGRPWPSLDLNRQLKVKVRRTTSVAFPSLSRERGMTADVI